MVNQRSKRVLLGFAAVLALWFEFKEGFIRHDPHDTVFFAAIPIMVVAFIAWTGKRKWIGAGALVIAICASWMVNGSIPSGIDHPWQGVRNVTSIVHAVTSPARQRQTANWRWGCPWEGPTGHCRT